MGNQDGYAGFELSTCDYYLVRVHTELKSRNQPPPPSHEQRREGAWHGPNKIACQIRSLVSKMRGIRRFTLTGTSSYQDNSS